MIIRGARDVEVYIGGYGHICIKQEKPSALQTSHDDTHQLIMLLPEQTAKLISALEHYLKTRRNIADSEFDEEQDEEEEDRE